MSLRARTVYTVNVGGGAGAAVPLKGGAQPFTTQEANDEDMFTPIRTQSGYLRIVDDGRDANGNALEADWWKDLIPATDTSRPVTLTHQEGGQIIVDWQGFLQAQTFSGAVYGNPQEREFPIQCVLNVTGGIDINYQQTSIQNFAYLLKTIIDSLPQAQRPTQYIIQGGTIAQTILLKEIDWQNFVVEDNDDGNLSARYPMYNILEDMCKFWGWSARTKGTTLYLMCVDDQSMQSFLTLTYAQLETMAGGTAAGTTSGSFDTTTLSGNIFASTDNNEQIMRGYKKAEVKVDGNAGNGIAVDCFPNKFAEDFIKTGQIVQTITDGDRILNVSNDKLSFDMAFSKGECVSGKASLNIVRIVDEQSEDSDPKKALRIKASYNGSVFASFESIYHHCFYDENIASNFHNNGGISLKGTAYIKAHQYTHNPGKLYCTMKVRVGIGASRASAKWFYVTNNPGVGQQLYGWGNTPTELEATLGDSNIFRVKGYDGFMYYYLEYLPTPFTNLKGKVFVDILGSNNLTQDEDTNEFDIHDFSVGFARNTYINEFTPSLNTDSDLKTDHTYKSKNQNAVVMNYNADCIFASDNAMQFGYGIIINPDGTFMKGIDYAGNGLLAFPEQHLADRVTSYWAHSRRLVSGDLQTQLVADITPKYKVTFGDMTYHPISISRDWRDDVTKVSLLELPANN